MASKGLLDDTPNRGLAKVEQVLLCIKYSLDPQDFYASDSSVLDEYSDLDQDSYECAHPEVQDDDQVESSIASHIWLSYLTYISWANWCETSLTLGSTTPVFACSAPVLHTVFTNCLDFIILANVALAATNNSHSSTLTL